MAPGGTGDAVPFASPASSLDLSEEELTVLREHPLEDLGRLTAQAQHDFVTAPSQGKDARHAYYRMLLNLGAKVLVDDGPEPTAETIERQRQYRERAQAEARRLASLPPAQREALLAAFKEDFFRDQRVPAAQEGRKP